MMALDPNLQNNIDPNTWKVLVALETRIQALEERPEPDGDVVYIPPDSIVQHWSENKFLTYDLRKE